MPRMDDDKLLAMAQAYETDSAQYVNSVLQRKRTIALNDYNQRPYGNEQEGWSGVVTSDVADTVEWLLPDLIRPFVSNSKAVVFKPDTAEQVEGAKGQTAAVNYVFYRQNNGFMTLYTAFKDALIETNCAVHWYKRTKVKRTVQKFNAATPTQIAAMMAPRKSGDKPGELDKDSLVRVGSRPVVDPITGAPMFDNAGQPMSEPLVSGRIVRKERKASVVIDAFEPENLLVMRTWTSPLLDECPYVCRLWEMTLSELNTLADDMGFDRVSASDLAGSKKHDAADSSLIRARRNDDDIGALGLNNRITGIDVNDESQTTGWVRCEWIIADVDGDGYAERRYVIRLDHKVLYDEEADEVPICTGSPIVRPHAWDGMGEAEAVSDLQLLHTELLRGVVNNSYASNNPRKVVQVDDDWAPLVDVDDLLDSRIGGAIRTKSMNAISMEPTLYVGHQMEPLLNRVENMTEKRSGLTKQRMGMDPNALRQDRTLGETQIIDTASRQRTELMARILGETIVIPLFRGIGRLLKSGDFDPLTFSQGSEFMRLDPATWDDDYELECTVGLGNGDTDKQLMTLGRIYGTQIQIAQSPLGPMMVKPRQIYETQAKLVELGGFKNPEEFFMDPGPQAKLPSPPPPQPPYQIGVEEMKQKGENERLAMELQANGQQERQARADQDAVQAANDQRDAQIQALKDENERLQNAHTREMDALQLQLDKYKIDQDNATKIATARIAHPLGAGEEGEGGGASDEQTKSTLAQVAEAMQGLQDAEVEFDRDPDSGAILRARRVKRAPSTTTET